ncbi:aromatic acid exporter family protein [Bacillus carboniphilus]|uniref:Aromatic acid exporter family protein n=1 Tax=Bacillus carboniphilus TaxID=86663 RepID=A0ABP3GDA8_9BACI
MKLGARIFKTGIAIMLALFFADLLGLPAPIFAGIAAVFSIQPTVYRSYLSILDQVQSNIIGAIVAVVFVYFLGNDILVIGLAVVVVIAINLKLKTDTAIGLSLVTVIAIMENPGDQLFSFTFLRFSTIMVGVASSFLINLVFLPPKYETKLFYKISNTTEEIIRWIRVNSRLASEHSLLKGDIEKLKENFIKMDHLYLLYKEERSYFKKTTFVKYRKLVIYRQMIATCRRALDILKRLHRFENELHLMPTNFQEVIQAHLSSLTVLHEQLILQFLGKIRVSDSAENYTMSRKELIDLFLQYEKDTQEEQQQNLFHMLQLISVVMEYGENLEHLEKLIHSFYSYHKDENQISIGEDDNA